MRNRIPFDDRAHVGKGNRRHGVGRPLIHFAFGVALMNIDFIAPAVMDYFA